MQRNNCADIICIGTQKAATSWLHTMLNIHPNTYSFPNRRPITSTNKEVHFFDWNLHRGVDWYRELLTPAQPHKLSMDFTPEYGLLSVPCVKLCKSINPKSIVVFIVRDPVARATSALRMHYLWRFGRERVDDLSIEFDEDFLRVCQASDLFRFSQYVATWERWRQHYKDSLVLINYEDIASDPRRAILTLFERCGLSLDQLDEERRARFDEALGGRVWESQPFRVSTTVVNYLEHVLAPHRDLAERHFSIKFRETVC
ncbi:MAG: hypothetical protein GVY36_17550 [Verrucomicrobia bacterium]|jgi:hypothetical protein|nr:hypothetical protein [Verrucomicrobiota bacterium]